MRYGEPVVLHQKIRLDFANVPPADFERIRTSQCVAMAMSM